MEVIFELIFQVLVEVLLQFAFQILAELGLRSATEPFRVRKNPVFAVVGYALLGGVAGGVSLLIFPHALVRGVGFHGLSLVLSPLLGGAAMAAVGAWRRGRGESLIKLDSFAYGFIFAFAMALVRFYFAA